MDPSAAPVLPSREHLDRFGFLFGYPIAHSYSPLFHQTIFDTLGLKWQQFLYESINMESYLATIRDPKFFGSSVTMPHKVAILPHLDEITDEGRSVGACNTIYLSHDSAGGRKLIGTNTDVIGIYESFYQNLTDPASLIDGRPGMVVGGGGAARAAVYALKKMMKLSTVYLVNRDAAEVQGIVDWCKDHGYGDGLIHVSTPEQAEGLEGAGAIVACVPDIVPVTEVEKAARATFEVFLNKPHKGAILEMAYHPKPYTAIAALSERCGWRVILGTEAMIYQGLAQSRLWTGRTLEELPVEKVKAVIKAKLSEAH